MSDIISKLKLHWFDYGCRVARSMLTIALAGAAALRAPESLWSWRAALGIRRASGLCNSERPRSRGRIAVT